MAVSDERDRAPENALKRGRAAYFALRGAGMGARAAARLVGVNYRTAKRWSAAARHRGELSPRYLTAAERLRIAAELKKGASARKIAAELGRAPSTVARELRRNAQPYRPHEAQDKAFRRRRQCAS